MLSITPVILVPPVTTGTTVTPVVPVNPEILSSQIVPLQIATTFQPFSTVIDSSTNNSASTPDSELSVSGVSNGFKAPSNAFSQFISEQEDNKKPLCRYFK